MAKVVYDVTYVEQHDRLTSAFRFILIIPHAIFMGIWGYAVEFVAVLQWFIILFTGQRNEGLWRFQRSWLGYASRVNGYEYLLYDGWPNFGPDWGNEPVAFGLDYESDANRLTNALRVLWVIPAAILIFVLSIGLFLVNVVSWFAILFTGKLPRGMFDFMLRVTRASLSLTAYYLLMTDDYPKYDGSAPTSTLPPGDRPGGAVGSGARPDAFLAPPSGPPAG